VIKLKEERDNALKRISNQARNQEEYRVTINEQGQKLDKIKGMAHKLQSAELEEILRE